MKTAKKLLASTLALTLILGGAAYLPTQYSGNAAVTASAAGYSFVDGDYQCANMSDGTVTIVKYTGSSATVNIPSTLGGKKVSIIGETAFMFNYNIKKVSIPDSVTLIEEKAFYNCANLEEVTVGKNVTILEDQAFFECLKLKKINIPAGVIYVGDSCFMESALTSVSIPNKNCILGANAFNGCTSLETLVLPGNLLNVPQLLCYGCSSLKNVTLPSSVQVIGLSAFRGCTSLKSLNVPAATYDIGTMAMGFDANSKPISGFTMYVVSGTMGETYAKNNKLNYKYGSVSSGVGRDVNGDGVVNVEDVTALAGHLKGLKTLSSASQKRADADGDGSVSVKDLTLIAAYVKGL